MSVLQVYLYGAGRDVHTKAQRRMDRFQRRHFRVGDVLVRPGRRVPVSHEFLAKHEAELVHHIQRGVLRLQTDVDAFIDADELKQLLAGTLTREKKPVTPVSTRMGKLEEAPEAPEVTPELSPPEEVAKSEEPVMAPETTPEPVVETAPEAEEPVMVVEESEPDALALPDAWRTRNKKGLLMLCAERGLVDASDKLSNKEIISMLEEWEATSRSVSVV